MNKRTLIDWIIATRPWSFTASVMPILVTLAYLFYLQRCEGMAVNWLPACLTLPMMLFMHAGGNLVSDYSDNVKRIDLPGSLNGVNHIYSGKFTPGEIRCYGWTLLAVGALLGICVVALSTAEVLWIGALGILLPLIYPWMKAHALGDVDILLCFALLPAIGVSRVATPDYHFETMLLSLTYGLLTVAILHANNTRDIRNDRRAHLQTLAGWLGGTMSQYVYLLELTLPYVLVGVFVAFGWLPWTSLIAWLTLPLALGNIRQMLKARPEEEQDIATLDQKTAQLQMAFALLLAVGLVLGGWFLLQSETAWM